MSAEIEASTGSKPELVPGSGGVFDVEVDHRLVFSKRLKKRFPSPGEIAAALNFDSSDGNTE